jgi:D-alanyl-D-alanine carboxypeptidase
MTFWKKARQSLFLLSFLSSIVMVTLLAACSTQAAVVSAPIAGITPAAPPTATASLTGTSAPTRTPTAAPSPVLFPTLFPLPTLDSSATLIPCDRRKPAGDDLFVEVNANYGLDPNYVPPDLVKLGDYLPGRVTLPEMLLRQDAAKALGQMVKAMLAEGLAPTVLSSYRSYFEQAVAHQRWVVEDPTNADRISAQPGHSEHQLGTVVDFGSPEMPGLTGSYTDKFSTLFDQTSESRWLVQHAYKYGFSMSSPPGSESLTGLAYEPWHYRYVGVEMAAYLHASGYFLDEYLIKVRPQEPCQP